MWFFIVISITVWTTYWLLMCTVMPRNQVVLSRGIHHYTWSTSSEHIITLLQGCNAAVPYSNWKQYVLPVIPLRKHTDEAEILKHHITVFVHKGFEQFFTISMRPQVRLRSCLVLKPCCKIIWKLNSAK